MVVEPRVGSERAADAARNCALDALECAECGRIGWSRMGAVGIRADCRRCSRTGLSRGWERKCKGRDWLEAVRRIMGIDGVKARLQFALLAGRRKEELSRAEHWPKSGGKGLGLSK